MSLNKKIVLNNGLEYNYFSIGILEVSQEKIVVTLDCFKSENNFIKFKKKNELLRQQRELLKEFGPLSEKENLTKKEQEKLDELQNNINNLADKINELGDINNLVSATIKEEIPYIEDFSVPNIEKELLKTENFKLAKIIE